MPAQLPSQSQHAPDFAKPTTLQTLPKSSKNGLTSEIPILTGQEKCQSEKLLGKRKGPETAIPMDEDPTAPFTPVLIQNSQMSVKAKKALFKIVEKPKKISTQPVIDETEEFPFKCQHEGCTKKFKKFTALGGHNSKAHPN